jgi:ATP-dependent Lon protease
MQESAKAAFTYVRSLASELGMSEKLFRSYDVHIHVPEGAIPKDGPSAGVAIVTALASAIFNVPVRADVAMTGEVTLRGRENSGSKNGSNDLKAKRNTKT